ncbi:lipocalin family protein [Candidatus Thioglobus sp.]|nr:lipocalin family protein [Candidatus Thioglobus sp.]
MKKLLLILFISLGLIGCASNQMLVGSPLKPMPVVDYVDLDRFMGDWYIIATIPTFLERDAYNPIETYQLDNDGSISTTFTFNKGSLNGPSKIYRPRGFVKDKRTNAIWGMQFVWPIKADYRIVYLDNNYLQTIIGRTSRDYVWIMARTPTISQQDYLNLVDRVGSLGYDLDDLQKATHAK